MKRAAAFAFVLSLAAAAPAAAKSIATLGPGQYAAGIKNLPCSACPPKVVETLEAVPGISRVKVDLKKSRLTFTVDPGSKVSVALLQSRLQDASEEMGMGADYSLQNIKGGQSGESKYKVRMDAQTHSYRFDENGNPIMPSLPSAGRVVEHRSAAEPTQEIYVCPMGDYRGPSTADGKCPKCGMSLQKQ